MNEIRMEIPQDYLEKFKQPATEKKERNDLLNQIFDVYDTDQETYLRKLDNIKRYKAWKKEKRHSLELWAEFAKTKTFLKPIAKDRMWFFISHVSTRDLYLVLSMCRDCATRNRSVGAYLQSMVGERNNFKK